MASFELKMLTDLSALPKVVETNISEVEPLILAAIEKTDGLLVGGTKAEVDAADADAAYLGKLRDAVKRFRIDNVALWKRPMDDFETKCKELEKRLDDAALKIRESTNAVKDKWRDAKRADARKQLDLLLDEAYADARLAAVRNSPRWPYFFDTWTNPKQKGSWLNATTSIASVTASIKAEIQRVNEGLEALKANYATADEEVKKLAYMKFCDTFDISATLSAMSRFLEERKQLEEARRIDAERKAAAEKAKAELAAKRDQEAAAAAPVKPAPVPTTTPAQAPTTAKADVGSHVETYRLEITGPRAAIKQMRDFGIGLGITFRKI